MQGRRSARARQGEVNEVAGLGVVPPAGVEGSGEWLRWVARVWAEIAIVGYLLWEATTPAPVPPSPTNRIGASALASDPSRRAASVFPCSISNFKSQYCFMTGPFLSQSIRCPGGNR